MGRKKGKPVSFDAMVKFFMNSYKIPTKKDVDTIAARLDRLETLMKAMIVPGRGRAGNKKSSGKSGRADITASDEVLELIRQHRKGIGFSDIQAKTGFGEKKIRNVIFRLNKAGMITRKSRGIYAAS